MYCIIDMASVIDIVADVVVLHRRWMRRVVLEVVRWVKAAMTVLLSMLLEEQDVMLRVMSSMSAKHRSEYMIV